MAANEFIVNLKADGSIKDQYDIDKVYSKYKTLASKLLAKDRGTFALNVLCILCRNLEKVPSWRDKVDSKALLTLSIECVRGTRGLENADRVKTLACVYHLHKHIVRKNSPIPPELILKLSYMPFENDTLLNEYAKTYWNILADRINYIEKLKPKIPIAKLLPKLSEDINRTILIYDTVQFCSNIVTYLVKKLNFIYSQTSTRELNQIFGTIFDSLTQNLKSFKDLNDKDTLELYVRLNESLFCVAENALKGNLKDSALNNIVRSCITMLGHRPDIFHCFQTFYSNTFCSLLTLNTDYSYMETVFNTLVISCETTERMGYQKTMFATYPFLSQLLRLYVEKFNETFTVKLQVYCLNFILFLMRKLKNTEQLWKCDNCTVKSGFHDSLRLSLLVKLFVKEKSNDENVLPPLHSVVKEQYVVLNELKSAGCSNYKNIYMKIQTDVHNFAVKLNSSLTYKYSIELFDLYLKNELENFENGEYKNICRALYNKSICESDYKLYEIALIDAYLSLIFARNQLDNGKYMSLVMDIKAKSLKDKDFEENVLQFMSVLEACKSVIENNYYGNMKPFLKELKFSHLLKHEFSKYAQVWPAINSIAGVWISLHELIKQKNLPWLNSENEDELLNTLYDIVLETPNVVRTMYNEYFNRVISDLLERFQEVPANTTDFKIIHVTLLFLKADFDLSDASHKYGWKNKETNIDAESAQADRTTTQEHTASLRALEAVEMWTLLVKELDTVNNTSNLSLALQVSQMFVYQLLYLSRTAHGLQLAHVCCQLAAFIGHKEAYITNAGTILSYMNTRSEAVAGIIALAGGWLAELLHDPATVQSAIVFICEAAMFYSKCGSVAKSARLVQLAQAHLLAAYDKYTDVYLELAAGRVVEAETLVCRARTSLAALTNTQRHYISISNTGGSGSGGQRRRLRLRLRLRARGGGARAAAAWRALGARRRARLHADHYEPRHRASPEFAPKRHAETTLEAVVFDGSETFPGRTLRPPDLECDPFSLTSTIRTCGLDDSMYTVKEYEDRFDGTVECFPRVEAELTRIFDTLRATSRLDEFLIDSVESDIMNEFGRVKLRILIEAAFFELSQGNYGASDDLIVRIHDMGDVVDDYMRNELMNLMTTSAQLRRLVRLPTVDELGVEVEFEGLKLSPARDVEPPSTPVNKVPHPQIVNNPLVVNDDEIPKLKRKVIKLNLDDGDSEETVFKMPVPVVPVPVPVACKPVLENITPRVNRSKPQVLVTQPSVDMAISTPKNKMESEFFTPAETPERFFTPMTSVKTYSRTKSLRQNIVKNLESEFSTPLVDKENATLRRATKSKPRGNLKTVQTLKRATSPGKLERDDTIKTRSRRLRQPVNFSLDSASK